MKKPDETMSGRSNTPSGIIRKNIAAISTAQREADRERPMSGRVSDKITAFSGSMVFVYIHVVWFSIWILLNVGLLNIPYVTEFDPFPFGLLTMVVSLEAIFLSTFVLISQNRMARLSEERAELDLHVNLLAEQKATKTLELLDQVMRELNRMNNRFNVSLDPEVQALTRSPEPQEVLRVMRETIEEEAEEVKEQVEKAVEDITDEMESIRDGIEEIDEVQEDVENLSQKVAGVTDEVREIKEKVRGEDEDKIRV